MKPTPPPEHDPVFLNLTQFAGDVFLLRDDVIIHEQLLLQTNRYRFFCDRYGSSHGD